MRSILISTLILAVATTLAAGQDVPEARLQIERIVLYKHGVGYFERQGEVTGDATSPLAFKSDEMKDVLKSLFAVDHGGGRISTILYDSKDPLSKQLQDILFTVPEEHALTRFLTQLKGARVEVRVGTEAVVGRILGLEPAQRQTPSGASVLVVKEERELGSRIQIGGLDAERIAVFLDEPYLSAEAREFLAAVAGLMRERAGVERGRAVAEEELGRLDCDQKRLRENMQVLRDSAKERTIREQYLERLMAADKRIEELHEAIRAAAARKQELEARLAEKVGSFRQG